MSAPVQTGVREVEIEGRTVEVRQFDRPFTAEDDLPEEFRDLVLRLLRVQADLESILLFDDYAHHLLELAPTPIDKMRYARLYAEEFTHAYEFWSSLADLGVVLTRDDFGHRISQYAFQDGYAASVTDWAEVAVLNTLTDRVGVFALAEWKGSTYGPMATLAPHQVKDEEGHTALGVSNLRKVITTDDGRARVNQLLKKWWPAALDMFGRSESTRQWRFIEWGLAKNTHGTLRAAYIAQTRPLLEKLGLEVPPDDENRHFT